jgi:hypothetical protein
MTLPTPHITELDVHAVRACIEGRANPDQQRRAMEWIGVHACLMKHSSALAESDRELAILSGMKHVAHLIGDMTLPSTLAEAQASDRARRTTPQPKRHK